MTPFFILAIAASLMMYLFSGVSGQCKLMMSDCANNSFSSTYRTPRDRQVAFGNGSNAKVGQPNPVRICATTVPICPVPITPTVFPCMSNPTNPVESEITFADPIICAMNFAVERQNKSDRVLGHRVRRVGRNAHHDDAVLRRGREIDIVITGTTQSDQPHA